ncbi:hypothetical protein Tco_0370043 [Tanacetum coccineum]
MGVVCCSLFFFRGGGVEACWPQKISALRLVDGRGIGNNGGVPDGSASSSAGTKSSGCSGSGMYTGNGPQVITLENVVPARTTVGQSPRKDPQMEILQVVPQSKRSIVNGRFRWTGLL